jgi:hypothetical protein
MKNILHQLNLYNVFNNLFPGVLFVIIAKSTTDYNFVQEDNFLGVFLYYFVGMTVSRFGSVIIEPLFKKIKLLKFRDYKEYIVASRQDAKIELLSEVNNTYRTLNSMMFLLLILKFCNFLSIKFELNDTFLLTCLILLTTALYLFSYNKQTNYITKRIDFSIKNNIEETSKANQFLSEG